MNCCVNRIGKPLDNNLSGGFFMSKDNSNKTELTKKEKALELIEQWKKEEEIRLKSESTVRNNEIDKTND